MPWQAHLIIGERIHTYEQAVEIAAGLGWKVTVEELQDGEAKSFKIKHKGKTKKVGIYAWFESESGAKYPSPETADFTSKDTSAWIGFQLTSRYKGEILDADEEHGRPDPFEIDIEAVADILKQVRVWWPKAQFLISDMFF